jgi:tRNA 5-methylaminomethyl-2-thiouridine biosynthesis bifunctional protein
METVLRKEKEIENLSEEFLPFYKKISSGYNQISFEKGKLDLILIIGDIVDVIQSFHAKIDAWYLDGFSPSKNPEMWTKEIFTFMKRNSKTGATFSTYSTAGFVREGLREVGFAVEKKTGFGNKKHMLTGLMPIIQQKIVDKPWFRIPKFVSKSKNAIIIGGGLSGTSIAFALSQKGFNITLIEREDRIASGASGNPAGMFAPLLTGDASDLSEWSFAAYREFAHFISLYGKQFPDILRQIGVYQIANSDEEVNRFKKAIENSEISSEDVILRENKNSYRGIFFPKAGWANPFELSNAYLRLSAKRVKKIISTSVVQLERYESYWKVILSNKEILESEIVILANSFDAKDFVNGLEKIKKVRGQILYYPSDKFPTKIENVILHEDGYIIPDVNGMHIIGSTFDPYDSSTDLNIEHNVYLLQKIKKLFPEVNPEDGRKMHGRVSFRAMSSDHLPMVGPVPDTFEFQKDYSDLWKANIYKDYPDGKYLPGLYISSAHGSKGILNSYLAANVLAAILTNEALPINTTLLEKINPSRYLLQSFLNRQ